MRTALHILFLCCGQQMLAQVSLNKPITLTATDSTLRQVHGLGSPVESTSAVDLETATSGTVHWGGTPPIAAGTLLVSLSPAITSYQNGCLIRLGASARITGTSFLNADGLGAIEILRNDQLPPQLGDVENGQVIQLQYYNGKFILQGHTTNECPTGYFKANERSCIQIEQNPSMSWFNASRACTDQGARLCTWDQYHYGCMQGGSQLNSLFTEWEWIDDTSDHTHTADQAGRWNCVTQRSVGTTPNVISNFRCCYTIR